jgi:hypothetical protein
MPQKRLIAEELEKDGEVCAMGSLCRARGINMDEIDPDDPEQVSKIFNIAECLAQEVAYQNDEYRGETPEERWTRMRKWAAKQIKREAVTG